METTQKCFLNSIDYIKKNKLNLSRKNKFKRLVANIYVFLAKLYRREDIFKLILKKP